jgi:hypothetical protein
MAFPGTYNFNYYRGDTAEFVVRPKTANGSAYNLTDYTATFTIANRRGSTGTQYVADATINTLTNIITCTIAPAVGRTLAAGTYVYDIQITNAIPTPDIILTVLTGSITVTDDITGAV